MRDDGAKNPATCASASATSRASLYAPATFVPLACASDALTISIDPSSPPEPTTPEQHRWVQACAHNPRLFNGSILRYLGCDAQACTIAASRECYLRYAVQQDGSSKAHKRDPRTPDNALYQLAVTGMLVRADAAGREHVLLGKRASDTWVYPNCWELAPAGGLENADYLGQLEAEMHEELGQLCQRVRLCAHAPAHMPAHEPLQATCSVLGLTLDPNTPSADIIVRVDLAPARTSLLIEPDTGSAWEYTVVRWVPIAQLPGFVAGHGALIIPPARAVVEAMGWLGRED